MRQTKTLLAYMQLGNTESETTLVFIHGSSMTKIGMIPIAEMYKDYNCICFDLTAHGDSKGPIPADVTGYAEDVEASILHLQEEGVITKDIIIMGYSLGGAVVSEVAIRKNVELKGIVFLSSSANMDKHTPLVDVLKSTPVEQFHTEDIMAYLFGPDTPQEVQEAVSGQLLKYGVASEIAYEDLMIANRYNRIDDLKGLEIPAMIVHGNDDQIIQPMAAIDLWNALPNSELLMIPYRGHAAIYSSAEIVADRVNSFITKIHCA